MTDPQNTLPSRGPARPNCNRLSLVAGVLIALCASGCGQGQGPAAEPPGGPRATTVKTVVAQPVAIPDASEYLATLKSRHSTALNPQVEGQITEIYVKSGDRVTAGMPIVQIDPLKQQATVSSQEAVHAAQAANVQYAQAQWERAKKLYEAGVVSKMDFDQAQTALDAAQQQMKSLESQVSEQQVQLRYYRVVAPTSGIIGDVPVHVGDRVNVNTLLTMVDEPGSLDLYLDVPIERARGLRSGQRVQIVDAAGGVEAESQIDFISPEVSTATQSVLAKATFSNGSGVLRTSQYVRARLIWSVHPGVTVPVLAVSRINGQFFVFVVEGNGNAATAHQRLVHLGELMGNQYPVVDGVKAGDHIVVEGGQNLLDGAPVNEVVPQGG